jgi:hypothetical protein
MNSKERILYCRNNEESEKKELTAPESKDDSIIDRVDKVYDEF